MTKERELERRIAELESELQDLRTQVQRFEILQPREIVPYTFPPCEPLSVPVRIWTDRTDGVVPTIYPRITWESLDGAGSANVTPVSWYDPGATDATDAGALPAQMIKVS